MQLVPTEYENLRFSCRNVVFFQPVVDCAMVLLDGINGFTFWNKLIQIWINSLPIYTNSFQFCIA